MSAQLIIELGAAETRAALIIDDEVARFWFGLAQNDPAAAPIQYGDEFTGRITTIAPNLGGAFVDIGAADQAFLTLPKKHGLAEGALICCVIKVEPHSDKGARVALIDGDAGEAVGPCAAPLAPALQALKTLGEEAKIDEIITNSGAAAAILRVNDKALVTHDATAPELFAKFGADSAYDELFAHSLDVKGGGRIIIDEGEGLTSIDVDLARATSNDRAKGHLKVNLSAAARAARAISQRQIGGQVVIDFLRMPFNDREKLNNELRRVFPSAQQASWSKTGLFSFSIPRARASFRDRFTAPISLGVLGARGVTSERLFKDAIWQAERALRGAPTKNFVLQLSARLYDYGVARTFIVEHLTAQYGGRLEIVMAQSLSSEMSLVEK